MAPHRSSGLDFSDRAPEVDHPDILVQPDGGPAHLQRNKTERRRLQEFMRGGGAAPSSSAQHAAKPTTPRERWEHWMVNEGGRRIFFSVWVFLQLLVAVFGFANYQLKDNLNNARATFGVTYGEWPVCACACCGRRAQCVLFRQRLRGRRRSCCTST